MTIQLSQRGLQDALSAAGAAHHEYETEYLAGVRDEQWLGWYAAFVIGRVGDFTTPTQLTRWLEETPSEGDWFENAAVYVWQQLRAA